MLNDKCFQTFFPTKVVFEKGAVKNKLVEKLKELQIEHVLIVTDEGLNKTNIIRQIEEYLDKNEFKFTIFSEVEPNPTIDTINKGKALFEQNKCKGVIAVGGGSSMDTAKAISLAANVKESILEYERGAGKKDITGPLSPILSIPTTAGTGSEVTPIAVITDSVQKRKFILSSPYLYSKYALIDPTMTYTLPQNIIAETGIDALVHAIETYVNNQTTPISDALSLESIKMIRKYLPKSYADPTNEEAKAQVLLASTIAGMSITVSGTALVHSISHPITSKLGVSHGLANAIILPYIIDFNLMANYKKYAKIACLFDSEAYSLTEYRAAEKLSYYIREFNELFNIPDNFNFVSQKINEDIINSLTEDTMKETGTYRNIRHSNENEILELYKQLLF